MIELGHLALGTAPIGGLYEAVEEDTARAVIDRAWELGIRYFDTAPLYGAGLAERRLGGALSGRPRDEYVVSTKMGRLLRPGTSVWGGAPELVDYFDFSHDATLRSLEESLGRLGLDRVDIAFVHDPDEHFDEALAGSFGALRRLRDEGVVRAIGVGANQPPVLCRFAREADPDYFLVAGRFTALDRAAEAELLPLCEASGISVIAGGVFNSGVIAGGTTFDYRPAAPEVLGRVARLREICQRHGVPPAAAAVQFPRRHPAVVTVLIGCSTPGEVAEDVELSKLDLPEELWSELA